jgi:hypothetical protein
MLVAVVLPSTAVAQSWNMRLSGGLSKGNFYGGSSIFGSEDRNGFAALLAAEYIRQQDDTWGFEFGIGYVDKGAKGKIEYNPVDPYEPLPEGFDFDGAVELGYIELNLLFNAHMRTSEITEFRVYLGPSLGNLVSAKVKGTQGGEDVDADIKDNIGTFDFGVTAGAAFAYEFSKLTVYVDARAIMGGTSITKEELNSDVKTRTFLIMAGIEIPLTHNDPE